MNTRRHFATWLTASFIGAALISPAQAQEVKKLRVALVPGIGCLSIYVAAVKGFFKAENLDLEEIPINTGPGAATAVTSNSADVGYGGTLPIILARSHNIPFRFVMGGYYEQAPLSSDDAIIASNKSGINSLADLKGKVIAVNNAGGVNDQQVRLKLAEAGIPIESVKILSVPFPQMQAALQIGNADAVATVEPFRTAILLAKLGKVIARGYVKDKDLTKAVPVGVFYATEQWINGNADTLARLKRSIEKANDFIKANPAEAKEILVQRLRLPADVVGALTLPPYTTTIDPAGLQAVMDAALSVGFLKKPMKAQEMFADSK